MTICPLFKSERLSTNIKLTLHKALTKCAMIYACPSWECLFVCIFVHICVYSFHMCYIRFGAYPNHMHIQIIVKKLVEKRKKQKEKHNSTD
jgi:type IV secretory pathway VirB3-like protein